MALRGLNQYSRNYYDCKTGQIAHSINYIALLNIQRDLKKGRTRRPVKVIRLMIRWPGTFHYRCYLLEYPNQCTFCR